MCLRFIRVPRCLNLHPRSLLLHLRCAHILLPVFINVSWIHSRIRESLTAWTLAEHSDTAFSCFWVFWVKATAKEGRWRVNIVLLIFIVTSSTLVLVWVQKRIKTPGVHRRAIQWWFHQPQLKPCRLERIWMHKPFHTFASRWIICSFNLHGSACFSAALCSP